jgi:hypothetical protein
MTAWIYELTFRERAARRCGHVKAERKRKKKLGAVKECQLRLAETMGIP